MSSWSDLSIYMLSVLQVLFYSPLYLSIIRILRISRVNNMIQLLERQSSFNIFKEPNMDDVAANNTKQFVLKWTTTSDQSTLFLDIVKKIGDEKIKFNWKLKFPQSFIICKFFLNFKSWEWNLQQTLQTGIQGSVADKDGRSPEGHR